MHYLPHKKKTISARSPALGSVRITPKICQGQLQPMYWECPKFHPNPFTSGGVIARRVNIVEMRHKVFPLLGEIGKVVRYLPHKKKFRLALPLFLLRGSRPKSVMASSRQYTRSAPNSSKSVHFRRSYSRTREHR